MTRSVAIALSTFGAASIACAADSVAIPEPSFSDSAVIESSDASTGGSSSEAVQETGNALPEPSFLDSGTPAWDEWHAGSGGRRGALELADSSRFPAPSFHH